MLQKIKNIILKHKKIILLGVITLSFFSFFNIVNAAQGEEPSDGGNTATTEPLKDDSQVGQNSIQKTVTSVVKWFNILTEAVSVLVALFTFLITMFLSPEWVNGTFFGLDDYIKEIWILISNIVYFIFAFLLIGIAFMNIVGIGGESSKFQLKQALPKFVVGILIVPLSRFIVNFFISISSVLTIAALNLPYDTFGGYAKTMETIEIPKSCELNLTDTSAQNKDKGEQSSEKKGNNDSWFHCPDEETVTVGDLMASSTSSSGIFGTIGLYTYGVLNIESFAKISKTDEGLIKTIGDLLIKVGFDLLFVLLYAILIVALGLVLMVRGIRLWIYMMFSPLFGLIYFLDIKGGENTFSKFNIVEFIKLAMVPVYAMLALSFGMLFIYVVGEGITDNEGKLPDTFINVEPMSSTGTQVISIGGKGEDKDNKVKLTIKGMISSSDGNISDFLGKVGKDTLGLIGSFIVKILGLVVLWSAMMAALKSSTITGKLIEPLEGFGKKVGEIAQKSPQYLPIFGGHSMTELQQVGNRATSYYDTKQIDNANKFMNENNMFTNNDFSASIEKLHTLIKNKQNDIVTARQLKEIINSKNVTDLAANQRLIDALKNFSELTGNKELKDYAGKLSIGGEKEMAQMIGELDKYYRIGSGGVNIDLVEGEELTGKATPGDINNATGHGTGTPKTKTPKIEFTFPDKNKLLDTNGNLIIDGQNLIKALGLTGEYGKFTKKDFISELASKLRSHYGKDDIGTEENAKILAKEIVEKVEGVSIKDGKKFTFGFKTN